MAVSGDDLKLYPEVMTSFPLSASFSRALELATRWHHGQYRKVSQGEQAVIPYLSHLLGVASIALEYGASEDEAIAALLHDTLEDGPNNTGLSAADLRQKIVAAFSERGEIIAHLVDGATDDTPGPDGVKRPWAERKRAYLRALRHKDASSLLVGASDKLHNARTILAEVLLLESGEREKYFRRFSQGQSGTLQYYRLLADTYLEAPGGQSLPRLRALFRELERTVGELEEACDLTAAEVRDLPLLGGLGAPV